MKRLQRRPDIVVKPKRNGFAQELGFYKLFWVFFIGSIAGVLIETAYCLIWGNTFEIRWGVIYGPFNPVYGFGAVVITFVLSKLTKVRDLWIFLICMFVGGTYEYLCSLMQELVFGTISWDYNNTQFNFSGRTNLLYAMCWGLLGLAWVRYIYPKLSGLIEKIPLDIGKVLTWTFFVFMILNMTISGFAIWRQVDRKAGVPSSNWLTQFLDETYPDEFLKHIYPNMKCVK
ncbi:MAG: hypothetical protein RUMPE_00532 [Eubacteriales bacterium SKADARSKE-1]|nr:hypothetical protein [Eubacteriales bacterium SKADARSKE-1]